MAFSGWYAFPMNAKQTAYQADPARALHLVRRMIEGDRAYIKDAAVSAYENGELYAVDLSCLVLTHASLNITADASRLASHTTDTWRGIFDIAATSRDKVAAYFEVNSQWLGEDVVGFLQNCLLPALGGKSPNIAVPSERGEGANTPFDEVVIHVLATVFCVYSVLQGVANKSPHYKDIDELVAHLDEYLRQNEDAELEVVTPQEIDREIREERIDTHNARILAQQANKPRLSILGR